jgi:hypothetical protein
VLLIQDLFLSVIKFLQIKIFFEIMFLIGKNCLFKVLFPKMSEFLGKHRLVDFLPMHSVDFFQSVTNEVINRRRNGLEVSLNSKKILKLRAINKIGC